MSTILVIEDDARVCNLLTETLRGAGYQVLMAYTAIAGLAQARDRLPNLVLLDLTLPDLDGLALLGRLAADPQTATLPVLVLSDRLDPATLERCRTAGAREVVPKPPDPARLLELVHAHATVPIDPDTRIRWEGVIGQGISRLVHADLDATRVCQAVVDGARQLLGLAAASLFLLEGDTLELRVQSSLFGRVEPRRYVRFRIGEGIVGTVARDRRSVAVADALRDPRFKNRETFQTLGLHALIAVPLLHDGQLLGVLSGARTSAGTFTPDDVRMLEALAEHAAAVLAQARLLQESERRRQTAEALAALATEVSAAQSPESVLDRVLDYVPRLVVADLAYLAIHEPTRGTTPVFAVRGARSPRFARLRPGPGQGITGWVMTHGRPLRTDDYLSEPRISHDFDDVTREEGIKAALSVPVVLQGQVVGVLGAQRRSDRPFTDEDERVLCQLAAQAAVALGNAWLYREARQAESQLRHQLDFTSALTRHLGEGLYAVDLDGRATFVNPAAERMLGWEEAELLGRDVHAAVRCRAADGPPEPDGACPLHGVLRSATTWRGDAVFTCKDGRPLPVAVTASPIVTDGRTTGAIVVFRDVTEQRRAEEEARARLRQQAAVVELGQRALGGTALATLLDEAVALVARTLDVEHCQVWELEPDGRRLRLRAAAGSAALVVGQATLEADEASHAGSVLRSGGPVVVEDWRAERRFAPPPPTTAAGTVSEVAVGIGGQERPYGILSAGSGQRRTFGTDDTHFLQAVASVLATVVQRSRTEEALRDREAQLRQAQKMEAIGRLAGGIAHDFNNLLTAITGYGELLLGALPEGDPRRGAVEQIRLAADRAAALTRQLLAFSRRQVLQPKVLDLNAVLGTLDQLLRRLIGEDIELVTVLAPGLGRVKVDPGQVEQVVLNLVVNARDAMPQGGRLTIETANVELDAGYARTHEGVRPGRYVLLAVSDTGCGMDAETRARIFEPFFTTKAPGQGTGLGLSTVYGIVAQSGGHIWVYSEPGRGATFKIYFPRVDEPAEEPPTAAQPAEAPGGRETVLLLEDDERVRRLACEVLTRKGYTVLEARSGDEALALASSHPGPIALLLTDVVMPGLRGREVAARLAPLRPEMKVLYMSGYPDAAIVRHGVLEPGIAFLPKPFTPDLLARRVREVLDS